MTDCLFCKIEQGKISAEIVYQDDVCIAFKDIYPKADVHILVIPRKHVESLAVLETEDQLMVGHMVLKLPQIAKAQGLENGFRTIINTGPGGGQEIYHLHFHILGGHLRAM